MICIFCTVSGNILRFSSFFLQHMASINNNNAIIYCYRILWATTWRMLNGLKQRSEKL